MTVREELHLESSVAKDWGEAGTGHWVGRVEAGGHQVGRVEAGGRHWVGRIEAEGAWGGGLGLPMDEH